jgi:hypothetical protein
MTSGITEARLNQIWPVRSDRLWCFSHVKNGESSLEMMIKSWDSCAPFKKVILVDTATTDKTEQIAKDMGCETGPLEWRHDYAYAKNRCIAKGVELGMKAGDFMLFNGDDMEIQCGDAIKTHVADQSQYAAQFHLPEHGYKYLLRTRLLMCRYHNDVYWQRPVHEEIYPSLYRMLLVGVKFVPEIEPKIIGTIMHYGHTIDKERLAEKTDYYKKLWLLGYESQMQLYEGVLAKVIYNVRHGEIKTPEQLEHFVNMAIRHEIVDDPSGFTDKLNDMFCAEMMGENGE